MDVVWIIFLFAIGACVGSFLNVVIYRLPRGESIVFPPSHCPVCGRPINWRDNIPILSWLMLRGKCRFCRARISPQYILVESAVALLVVGLYVCYYVLRIRDGGGAFEQTWPMFAAHAALLCGLLACSLVDIKQWLVPLEVCWLVSLVGIVSATADPHPWVAATSAPLGAAALAAAAGLGVSLLLLRFGLIQRSFLDADDSVVLHGDDKPRGKGASGKTSRHGKPDPAATKDRPSPKSVAITKAHGVSPRKEVLREVLFLAPAIILAAAAYLLVTRVAAVGSAWTWLNSPASAGRGR